MHALHTEPCLNQTLPHVAATLRLGYQRSVASARHQHTTHDKLLLSGRSYCTPSYVLRHPHALLCPFCWEQGLLALLVLCSLHGLHARFAHLQRAAGGGRQAIYAPALSQPEHDSLAGKPRPCTNTHCCSSITSRCRALHHAFATPTTAFRIAHLPTHDSWKLRA